MADTGRPPRYETPEQMQVAVDKYFDDCDANDVPYTVTGLCLALGFLERKSLINYEGKEAFVHTVKEAKMRVQASVEAGMMRGYNAAGCIFNLKNNYGWVDKTEQDMNVRGEVKEIIMRDAD